MKTDKPATPPLSSGEEGGGRREVAWQTNALAREPALPDQKKNHIYIYMDVAKERQKGRFGRFRFRCALHCCPYACLLPSRQKNVNQLLYMNQEVPPPRN